MASPIKEDKYLPSCGYTTVIQTSDAVLWTRSLGAVKWIFIGIITTVVISVTKPIWLDADIGLFTFKVIRRTFCILRTLFMCFVRSYIIFTIVHSITNLKKRKK